MNSLAAQLPASRVPQAVESVPADFPILSEFAVIRDGSEAFDWESDVWDLMALAHAYGLKASSRLEGATVRFSKIKSPFFRKIVKSYLKTRVLTRTLAVGTLSTYRSSLVVFFNTVSEIHPDWTDLANLSRADVEAYLDALLGRKISPKTHNSIVGHVRTMLTDMQVLEDPRAPAKPSFALIWDDDYRFEPPDGSLDYVPAPILEGIFDHFDDLDEQMRTIFVTGYKTGLRVGDVLDLTPASLIRIGGQAYIRHHVNKSDVEDHLVPVDAELEALLGAKISRKQEDPVGKASPYIFYEAEGSRAGKPLRSCKVNDEIRFFIARNHIKGADGKPFYFHFHQLRHTFGIVMRQEGVDLRTLQELYAHATITTTMRYAQFLGEDKRKAFERAKASGCFDLAGAASRAIGAAVPPFEPEALAAAVSNGSVSVLEVPYGTCLAPSEERCQHAAKPPCLFTHRGGVCRDLLVGALESDVEKYEVHIRANERLARIARACGREDLAETGRRKIERLEAVYREISRGNMVSGDVERLKRRLEERTKHG